MAARHALAYSKPQCMNPSSSGYRSRPVRWDLVFIPPLCSWWEFLNVVIKQHFLPYEVSHPHYYLFPIRRLHYFCTQTSQLVAMETRSLAQHRLYAQRKMSRHVTIVYSFYSIYSFFAARLSFNSIRRCWPHATWLL